nr:MAG TPA: hypothetical protein [Crassvirales sp.]
MAYKRATPTLWKGERHCEASVSSSNLTLERLRFAF